MPNFRLSDKKVAAYFYYWHKDGQHRGEPLTDHPAGPDTASWDSVSWFRQQLSDMAYCGIDIVLPSYWGPEAFNLEPGCDIGLRNLVTAHDEITSIGKKAPSIGMFLDTGAIGMFPEWARNLQTIDGSHSTQLRVYLMIKTFFQIVPKHHWATIEGRPLIWLWAAYFGIAYDRTFVTNLLTWFTADFGVRPYIVAEESWRYARLSTGPDYSQPMPFDDWYVTGAAAWGFDCRMKPGYPVPYLGGIAEVGPGYDERLLGRPDPVYRDREDGAYFARELDLALESGKKWIAIETWNEHHEGSSVCETVEYGREYIEILKAKNAKWRAPKRHWWRF